MIRARVGRLAAAATIGSLLAIQAMAGSVGAAVPGADAHSEAIPSTYTAGHAAGFRGFFNLTDTSTLAKLYLRIDVDPAQATFAYKSILRNGAAVPSNACDVIAQDVVCTFKTVRNTDFFVATVGYTPSGATVNASFAWSSTGIPDNGDNSHGDAWDGVLLSSTLTTGDVNYGGAFTIDGDTSVANGPVSGTNVQAAKLVGLPVGVPATVRDGPSVTGSCTTTPEIDCNALFGEWTEISVGDGLTYPVFQLQITYASGTPKGFVHSYVQDGTPLQEFVGPCAKKSPTYPCFTWNAKTNTATILTTHNGTFKGR